MFLSEVGAVWGSSPRTDLFGGPRVIGGPTEKVMKQKVAFCHHFLRSYEDILFLKAPKSSPVSNDSARELIYIVSTGIELFSQHPVEVFLRG